MTRSAAMLALVSVAGLPSCKTDPASGPQTHVLEIRDFAFQAPTRPVTPGDSLVWVNRDLVPHAVAMDGENSGPLLKDERWGIVVTQTTGIIRCPYHPEMQGSIDLRAHR